jgi:gliding motility-associated-like protein/uncharacterized repeat protein (TIGR01451 family)
LLKKISLLSLIFFLIWYLNISAKSLYLIADVRRKPVPIKAYDIQGSQLVFQKKYTIPNRAGGAVGIALDSDSEFLFITYENSGVIQIVNARTMSDVDTIEAPYATNLAGIVVDHEKKKIYTMDRETDHLYVYSWDADNITLSLDGDNYVGLSNISKAYGIALDEKNGHLYVADNDSYTIRYYETEYWNEAGSFSISQRPMGIAVDVNNRFVYTGNAWDLNHGNQNLLIKYDMSSGIEISKYMGDLNSAVGLAVDQETGFLYVTTGCQRDNDGTDEIIVFDSNLGQLFTTGDIYGNPAGLCVPENSTSYNPLNLSKEDGLAPEQYVYPGDTITYSICFDNVINTQNSVNNVIIRDLLPSKINFISATGGTFDPFSNTVVWKIKYLAPGAFQQCMQLMVQVDSTAVYGDIIHNECTIDSDETPPTTQAENTKVKMRQDTMVVIGQDTIPIYPYCSSSQYADQEFWLDIWVGDADNPVKHLFNTSFIVHWDKDWIELVTSEVEKGDFWGSPDEVKVESWYQPYDSLLAVAVTRIDTSSTVSGYGIIMRILFRSKSKTPNNTDVCFNITEVTVMDSAWNPIVLIPRDCCMEILRHSGIRPNPFTPNDDGYNDYVEFNLDELKKDGGIIIIFDIWGKRVRQIENSIVWDGKDDNGDVLQPGSYLYIVKSKGKVISKGILGLAR